MAYALAGLDHIQVSLLPGLNKMMLEHGDPCHKLISGTKNCPEYWARLFGSLERFVTILNLEQRVEQLKG